MEEKGKRNDEKKRGGKGKKEKIERKTEMKEEKKTARAIYDVFKKREKEIVRISKAKTIIENKREKRREKSCLMRDNQSSHRKENDQNINIILAVCEFRVPNPHETKLVRL